MNASFCCSAIVVSFLWISLCPVLYVFARLTVFDFEIFWLLLEQTVVRMRKNGKGPDNNAFTTTRANKRDPFVVRSEKARFEASATTDVAHCIDEVWHDGKDAPTTWPGAKKYVLGKDTVVMIEIDL